MAQINDPHDRFFRMTFSRREVAEGFLRGCLPPAVVAQIDWPSLAIAKDSFVEKALRGHFSDLLYSVRCGAREIKVYLLVEHKSHPDAWVPLQLLRYLVRIWELHRKQKPRQPLPPVLPLVLYHGAQHWTLPERFRALFGEIGPELEPYIPEFRYEFCDVALPEPEAVRAAVLSRLAWLAFKHVFDPDPKRALADILPLIKQILDKETALEMLEVLLRYYVLATKQLNEDDIHQLITHDDEGAMQTFIERYIEEGRQQGWLSGKQEGMNEGMNEGRKEGRKEGKQEERVDLLLRLLSRKFGAPALAQRRRVEKADGETLLRWCDQVLFADSIDEALR